MKKKLYNVYVLYSDLNDEVAYVTDNPSVIHNLNFGHEVFITFYDVNLKRTISLNPRFIVSLCQKEIPQDE